MRSSLARAVAACATLACVLLLVARLGQAGFTGTPVAAGPAPPLSLTTDTGTPFSLAASRGRALLVYFGYTHCPDVCPATLAALGPVLDRLGAQRARVDIVFVTLDPERDTPGALHAYLANFVRPGGRAPIGLTGAPAVVARIADAWGVRSVPRAGGMFMDHSSVLTLVDPAGMARVRYGVAELNDPAGMAADIARVLRRA